MQQLTDRRQVVQNVMMAFDMSCKTASLKTATERNAASLTNTTITFLRFLLMLLQSLCEGYHSRVQAATDKRAQVIKVVFDGVVELCLPAIIRAGQKPFQTVVVFSVSMTRHHVSSSAQYNNVTAWNTLFTWVPEPRSATQPAKSNQ